MTEDHAGGDASRRESIAAFARGAADWLSLAAAPAFAIMALLTAAHISGPADILCSAAHGASPLSGMTARYALMSVVHAAPWLRLITSRRPLGLASGT